MLSYYICFLLFLLFACLYALFAYACISGDVFLLGCSVLLLFTWDCLLCGLGEDLANMPCPHAAWRQAQDSKILGGWRHSLSSLLYYCYSFLPPDFFLSPIAYPTLPVTLLLPSYLPTTYYLLPTSQNKNCKALFGEICCLLEENGKGKIWYCRRRTG